MDDRARDFVLRALAASEIAESCHEPSIRASFLAGKGMHVAAKLVDLEMHRMDLSGGAVLEKGESWTDFSALLPQTTAPAARR